MADNHWETLVRNGQMVWEHSPEHRVMLERYYRFWKGTVDEQIIASRYPAFYAVMQAQDAPVIQAKPSESVTETTVVELPIEAPKEKGKRTSSPTPDVIG